MRQKGKSDWMLGTSWAFMEWRSWEGKAATEGIRGKAQLGLFGQIRSGRIQFYDMGSCFLVTD